MTGPQFRKIREKLKLTQAQLGAELDGRDRRTIWLYETERTPIPRTVGLAMTEWAKAGAVT